jgi:hypothetical protein
MKRITVCSVLMLLAAMMTACKSGKAANDAAQQDSVSVPSFSADSAMSYLLKQCDFGARVLGTKAHDDCAQYIASAFKSQGCEVSFQEAEFTFYNGSKYKGCNIIASTNPDAKLRIMLCAHWDSRPWADADPDESNHKKPVMAANDGASGVAVLIELARQLKNQKANIGVDFVCFDAEDAGVPDWDENYAGTTEDEESTWCLGSQYWANNPHRTDIEFAVLLDMVGGQGATFYKEQFSSYYAPAVVERVWAAAREAGYSSSFPDEEGGGITDDHLPLNRIAQIPAIDIISYYPNQRPGFCPTWHTVNDTPENIDPNSLKVVGQTLLQLIYTM